MCCTAMRLTKYVLWCGGLLHLALQTMFHLSINTEQISLWIFYPEKTCLGQLARDTSEVHSN